MKASGHRFRRYPEYKDSGVEWLEAIPKHWLVKRLKTTITGCQNGLWGDEPDGINDVICIRVADFDRQALLVDLSEPTFRSIDAHARQARLLKPGDLLLEKSGGGEKQPVGYVVVYDHSEPAICSNFIARMPVADGLCPRYLTFLHATIYSLRLNSRSIKQSTGIQNLDSGAYLDEKVSLPPLLEQQAISAFLAREKNKIDALIAKKERVIHLLENKRTALIVQAVTKGLDPKAPMKASGVEWLGSVPAHWEVIRTKYVARLESGHTPSRQHPEYWEDCTIPWFGLVDVWQIRDGRKEYASETSEQVSELGLANSAARLLPKGTVILSRTASVGFSAIMAKDMATTQDFVNWVCGTRIRAEYLLYVFRSMTQEFRRLTMGSTHQTIYMPDVARFVTPLPPIEEQDGIVVFIRKEVKRIDDLIAKVNVAIKRIKEFRAALISAAVTGKIDVREEGA